MQIDGCEHAWFEDRGPACTLLAFVDDATSRLMLLRFVPSESAFAYFAATRAYIEAHGKPVAFYSDKLGVFRVNRRDATGEELTQFGRALAELTIDVLCANTPQAKGRVERAFATLQDRLVKELRLASISTGSGKNLGQDACLPRFGRHDCCPDHEGGRLATRADVMQGTVRLETRMGQGQASTLPQVLAIPISRCTA